jgi:hypothetical protein
MTQNIIASAVFLLASAYALYCLVHYLVSYLRNDKGGCSDKCACSAKDLVRETSKSRLHHRNITHKAFNRKDLHSLRFEKNRNKS